MKVDDEIDIDRDRQYFLNLYTIRYHGRDIGFFSFVHMKGGCYIHQFEIDDAFQGKKIGSRVYRFFERNMLKKDRVEVSSMDYSVEFWKKMGFQRTGSVREKSVMMYKEVTSPRSASR